jgi:hypothetical protein
MSCPDIETDWDFCPEITNTEAVNVKLQQFEGIAVLRFCVNNIDNSSIESMSRRQNSSIQCDTWVGSFRDQGRFTAMNGEWEPTTPCLKWNLLPNHYEMWSALYDTLHFICNVGIERRKRRNALDYTDATIRGHLATAMWSESLDNQIADLSKRDLCQTCVVFGQNLAFRQELLTAIHFTLSKVESRAIIRISDGYGFRS